jgi:hypothetical protein
MNNFDDVMEKKNKMTLSTLVVLFLVLSSATAQTEVEDIFLPQDDSVQGPLPLGLVANKVTTGGYTTAVIAPGWCWLFSRGTNHLRQYCTVLGIRYERIPVGIS